MDVLADELMWDVCKTDPLIKEGASEEEPEVRLMHADGKFCVCWDPLDGETSPGSRRCGLLSCCDDALLHGQPTSA